MRDLEGGLGRESIGFFFELYGGYMDIVKVDNFFA